MMRLAAPWRSADGGLGRLLHRVEDGFGHPTATEAGLGACGIDEWAGSELLVNRTETAPVAH